MKRKMFILFFILLLVAPAATFLGLGALNEEEAYKKDLEALDDFLNRLDSIEGLIDRSAFNIEDISKRLNHDAEKLFRFVRDEIDFQVYTGALRGSQGTLLEGAGNSIDQSLLLLSLLQANGESFQCRFVQGTLSSSKARELIAKMLKKENQSEEAAAIVKKISIPMTEKCLKYVACLLQGVMGGGPLYQTNAECLLKFLQDLINDSIKNVRRDYYMYTAGRIRGSPLGETVKTLLGAYWKIYDTWINP